MLNITVAVVPAQPNQITLFFFFLFFFLTSAASQHGFALSASPPYSCWFCRGHEDGGTLALILRRLIGIPLQVSSLYVIWEKRDGFSREGSWLIRPIGIKEGPAINGGDVREPERSIMQASRGAAASGCRQSLPMWVWSRFGDKARGMWRVDVTRLTVWCMSDTPDRIVSPLFAQGLVTTGSSGGLVLILLYQAELI